MSNSDTGLPAGIDLELLAYDISDMLVRNEYPLDVCAADILPALGDFLRVIIANAQEAEGV
jgi:hypothetical protein